MHNSICIDRVTQYGPGRGRRKFCVSSRIRCRGLRAFFCVSAGVIRFAWSRATEMLLFLENDD